jgi:hypothetical protein
MTPPPTNIDGTDITGATIDGQDVQEITIDGQVVFTAAPDITASGVARWTFDNADTQGGTAVDVFGNNDATINGATTGVPGANETYTTNQAYRFDGSNDDVQTPIGPPSQSDFSWAVWMKPASGAEGAIMSNWGSFRPTGANLAWDYESSNRATFSIRDNSNGDNAEVETSFLSTNTWHHIIAVRDYNPSAKSGQLTLYVDGSDDTNNAGNDQTADDISTANVRIGASGLNGTFDGDIDDARVYNGALNSTEASNLYNTGSING